MVKNRVFYGLLLFLAAVLYVFTNTYYTLTLLVLCFLVPLISLGLMLLSCRNLDLSLELPGTGEKQQVEFSYRFTNRNAFPVARLLAQVHLENQLTGTQKAQQISATIGGRKTVIARLSLQGSKVGTVAVSTRNVRVCDAFGLFSFPKADLPTRTVVVYPDLWDAPVHMERPIETSGDSSRYSPYRPGQDVSEIFSLREYAAGDQVRKIHWKLSAKMDKTMVREFSHPLNYSIFLLMELTKGSEDILDAMIELYLSLSHSLLTNGINHSLAWYDAGEEAFHVRELDRFEDLDMAAAQVLSSYAAEQGGTALDCYAASTYRNRQSVLIYVTADLDLDKIAEIEVSQTMRTVFLYETEEQKHAAGQVANATAVSVEQMAQGVPEIIL